MIFFLISTKQRTHILSNFIYAVILADVLFYSNYKATNLWMIFIK